MEYLLTWVAKIHAFKKGFYSAIWSELRYDLMYHTQAGSKNILIFFWFEPSLIKSTAWQAH